jgi:hypothetical protein
VEPVTPSKRIVLNARRLFAILVSRIRRALGILLQLAQRDQLRELSHQTQRLSSASVESVTYVGGELQTLDERLSRIEEQLAALRRAVENPGRTQSAEESGDELASDPHSG